MQTPEKTKGSYKYAMLEVGHLSSYVIFVPLPDKHAGQTDFAFEHHVFGCYKACAEVVIDEGSE